jgi:tetratricopeptide (TPR) repeat protein
MRSVIAIISVFIFCSFFYLPVSAEVKVWEEPLLLPTYVIKSPEKVPMFFRNQSYQGASRYIYPYALEDNVTNQKIDKTYKAIYLENEYIKLCVLPEIGGRLFYATDKTNGYEIFYRQHVIKPANIGMLGAWISGGVEFCVFHHHRASTNFPVDYRMQQNRDGSATIWVGETEPRHRMKWTLGITLYPGRSYIEVDGRLINPTENVNSILYWANVATHVNDDYQVIFPPETDVAVYHAKNSFVNWPITSNVYNGYDYYKNHIDASWWKNHPNPISMFAHEIKDGFLAGYDHGKRAGTMHVGNHHIVKGAKLWEWGPGASGSMWDSKVLTDSDGPYAELMTGAYSDNQPDYSWLKPYEYKTFRQYWYPLRETAGAVAANLNATLNLSKISEGEYLIAVNTTKKYDNMTVHFLKKNNPVFELKRNISPDNPFSEKIKLSNLPEDEIRIILLDDSGKEVISYKPVKKDTDLLLPDPVVPPDIPENIESLEELYLTGLRIKQFHNARINSELYFQEALKRDPLDIRSNTMMGILQKQDFKLEDGAGHFRRALKRLTANYTRPRNCEPFYHLGVILQQERNYEAAYDTLYRAAWDQNFASAAYFHLAQISIIKQNYEMALSEINRSIDYNSSNIRALNLKTSLLRKMGYKDKAIVQTEAVLEKDALNSYAINEGILLGGREKEELEKIMQNNPESYLELAVKYLNSGFQNEARLILEQAINSNINRLKNYPTIHYYLGYIFSKENNAAKAGDHFNLGKEMPTDYCFPFRFETIDVYLTALAYNPSDSRAYYYLGNLFYDKQPDKAIEYWEKTIKIEEGMAFAYRNLGWGYNQARNDLNKAIAAYESAIQYDKSEPRFYYELDKLYEKNGSNIEKRYKLLTGNHQFVSQRPDAFLREVHVLLLYGENKKAIQYLVDNFFPRQEGVDNLHEIYADACLAQGIRELKTNHYESALEFFKMADKYPENHQIARNINYEKNAQIFYYQALVLELLKKTDETSSIMKKVSDMNIRAPQYKYYQALACQKSGNSKQANLLAKEIETAGNELLSSAGGVDFFSKFGEGRSENARQSEGNYFLGLANILQGNFRDARQCLEKAIQLDPGALWAKIHLENIQAD